MNSLKANTLNELQKLFSKKKNWVFIIVMAAISFLSGFFISTIQSKLIFIAMSSVSFPLMILSIFTNVLLPLFIFMASSELFAGEVADRTLKLVLTMPISRLKVYISKIIAICIYIIINLLIILIVSIISSSILNMGALNILHITLAYFIDIIPSLILAIFSALIVQFFRSSSSALISCILIFMIIKILSLLSPAVNNNTFTSYLNWYPLWLSSGISLKSINILLLMLSYGIIFFTIGYYMFDKKEM